MDDLEYVLARIEPWVDSYIDVGAPALTPLATTAVGVWLLESEVNNGGFDQYYFSSAGDLALPTVEALKAIGAFGTASLLSAANAEFPEGQPPEDRDKRQAVLDEIRDSARFRALEQEFYCDKEQRLTLLAHYLRTHDDGTEPPLSSG